jgi:zinc protease
VKNKKLIKHISICLLLTACCLLSSKADALNVKKAYLPNGLVVLHSENHSLPIVMVTLFVKAGQINEPKNKAGLTNLLAELITEGTKHRTSRDISEEIEFIGASLNASAGSDYMTVSLSVLKKDIDKGFELFSDILLNPIFPQEEIERQKALIKGVLRQKEEEPAFLAKRAFKKEVYGEHPYGRLIEGSVETIEGIKRDDLLKFYSAYFLPNNSIVSIAGDLTTDELNSLIKKYLNDWEKGDLPYNPPSPLFSKEGLGRFSGKKTKKVLKIDRDLTQANILLGHTGVSRCNPDYYAISVMNYILGGGGLSSRLMRSIRENMGLAYDVDSFFAPNKEGGMFQVEAQTKNASANLVISEVLKQMERMRKEYVSAEDLSEAKAFLTGIFPMRLDTNRKIADFLAYVEFYNLGLDYVGKYPDYINSVTKDDVLRVAQKYLDPENYVLVVVANQKKALLKY